MREPRKSNAISAFASAAIPRTDKLQTAETVAGLLFRHVLHRGFARMIDCLGPGQHVGPVEELRLQLALGQQSSLVEVVG